MLTELEKKIIASIQQDIAVTERPYLDISKKLGISEKTFIPSSLPLLPAQSDGSMAL
jgi:hypothetical protein